MQPWLIAAMAWCMTLTKILLGCRMPIRLEVPWTGLRQPHGPTTWFTVAMTIGVCRRLAQCQKTTYKMVKAWSKNVRRASSVAMPRITVKPQQRRAYYFIPLITKLYSRIFNLGIIGWQKSTTILELGAFRWRAAIKILVIKALVLMRGLSAVVMWQPYLSRRRHGWCCRRWGLYWA